MVWFTPHISVANYHCTVCCKLFKSQPELDSHECGKTRAPQYNEKTHLCQTCGKTFTERCGLTKHIRTVHDKQTRYKCPYCRYCTDLKHDLTRHVATHTGDAHYKCTLCDYAAVRKVSLTSHIYKQHTNKSYKCQYKKCNTNRSTLAELYEHIRLDHPVERYRCDVCPMTFGSQNYLNNHTLTHNDKSYQCKYCDKYFTLPHHLSSHLLTHTGVKQHKCSACSKEFNQKGHLTVHMKIHTGERRYQCSYCDKRFTRNDSRDTHEITCEHRDS